MANQCKDKTGKEVVLQDFSIIFGENASGKSLICELLKSLFQVADFSDHKPDTVGIEALPNGKKSTHKYTNGSWSSTRLSAGSIIFFDVDYINANVHTHGLRASNLEHGGHTQNAGQLIVDSDAEANRLNELVATKQKELRSFKEANKELLQQQFTEEELELFTTFEDANKATQQTEINKLQVPISMHSPRWILLPAKRCLRRHHLQSRRSSLSQTTPTSIRELRTRSRVSPKSSDLRTQRKAFQPSSVKEMQSSRDVSGPRLQHHRF